MIDARVHRNRFLAILIALAFLVVLAPTLWWQEFSNSMENLVLATSMEMHRSADWLVPTLQGELRVAKPPLAAWITNASVRPQTLRDIDSMDHNLRERGFILLALEARWPALLAACLLLIGVFELGRETGDSTLGLSATAICASTYLLLRFSRYATIDIYLALWVTWANVFLARAILHQRFWSAFLGGGLVLGIAMLTKGPVALVQTIVPAVLYLILPPRHGIALRRWGWPLVAGVAIFLTSGLWWFALVIARKSGVLDLWYSEVARTGTGRESGTPVLTYLGIVYFIFPWTIFLIAGLMATAGRLARREKGGGVLALLLLVVPLLVMTFVRDRQDRYALPMIPAAAVVIAVGVREYLRDWQAGNQIGRRNAWMHWSALAFVAVFVPIAGATPLLKQENGQPWFSLRFAVMEACFGAALVLAGILLHRRRPGALVAMTLVTMLVMQAVIFKGYCTSDSGRSGMKGLADVIGARYPDASFYNAHPRGKRPPTDLGVYLNRTIFWTGDPSQLRSSDHPIVLFMLQNNGEPEPQPPPGWHVVDKARRDKDWWWAFVLPPS